MTDAPHTSQTVMVAPAKIGWREWIATIVAVAALLLTVTLQLRGAAQSDGELTGRVSDNTRRIGVLEQRASLRDDQQADLRERIGKMDAKLDLLLEQLKSTRR